MREGYSKTGSYRVLVNGSAVDGIMGDETGDTFLLTGVSGSMTITVEGVADITPPAAEIAVSTNKFSSFMNTITFGLFFKKTQTVTVTASDVGSGLSKAEYLLSETAFADKDAIAGNWTELTLTEGSGEPLSIEPRQKSVCLSPRDRCERQHYRYQFRRRGGLHRCRGDHRGSQLYEA